MSNTGVYPPTGETGILIDKLSDLPNINHGIKDYNEFYRLYEDDLGRKYIYRIKSPNSPLNKLISDESNS